MLQEGLALARATGDVIVAVLGLSVLVRVVAILAGDLDQAGGYAEEAVRLARAAGLKDLSRAMSYNLGLIAAYRGEVGEAGRLFEHAMTAFQEGRLGNNFTLAMSDLAHLERKIGNFARALELYRDTIIAFAMSASMAPWRRRSPSARCAC